MNALPRGPAGLAATMCATSPSVTGGCPGLASTMSRRRQSVKAQRLPDLANRRLSSVGGMLTLSPLAVIHPAEVAVDVVHPVHESEPSGRVRHAQSRRAPIGQLPSEQHQEGVRL